MCIFLFTRELSSRCIALCTCVLVVYRCEVNFFFFFSRKILGERVLPSKIKFVFHLILCTVQLKSFPETLYCENCNKRFVFCITGIITNLSQFSFCVFCFILGGLFFPLNHRITAYGAAGGRSVLAMSRSHGVYITGDFLLRRGEMLYILVGQQGEDACPSVSLILLLSLFGDIWELTNYILSVI